MARTVRRDRTDSRSARVARRQAIYAAAVDELHARVTGIAVAAPAAATARVRKPVA